MSAPDFFTPLLFYDPQPGWPQPHLMSAVSPSPSQYVLQYLLPGRAWQWQLG